MHKVDERQIAHHLTLAEPASTTAEGGPQSLLVDPPEGVLLPVDQHHRDLLGILGGQRLIVEDGKLQPADPGVLGHSFDHGPGVLTQMTAGLTDQGDPVILTCLPHLGRLVRLPY